MKTFKQLVRTIFRGIGKIFYPTFNDYSYFDRSILIYVFFQKIIGINRHVAWPVHFTSVIKESKNIQRGSKAPGYAMKCYIDGRNGIILEENVRIGPGVSIISMNHNSCNFDEFVTEQPIIIRKNSWLASNSIILAGVELGEHTIVAAGAVVTKSFIEGNQVLAGNPARVIKNIAPYQSKP